ncbi:hypothetical protein [Dyadobacter frigoris]|uniref:DUF1440 domain-containing protein n=1 Tax=Dyadobacter frigoris TaxID=2576211 RepID=A0A4U6CL42_9BACT|nr:hypothetical protein [Dyadobacter frigoris]TKT84746.1 hypothetical protein FDK13_34740 [Dyadobacter frigoris]
MNKQSSTFVNGLKAGLLAISINTIFLKAGPLLKIKAESGGLLKLILLHSTPYLNSSFHSIFQTTSFWLIFHYLTGFAMVALYVYILEPWLPYKGCQKGSVFSLVPWLINAFIVLPLLGQGIAGLQALPLSGIIYFFIANWLFAIVLGILYERFKK